MERFVKESNSSKWKGYAHDEFVLNLADMDVALDPQIKKAMIAKLQRTNNFTYKTKSKEFL